jgi:hypothetical protein
MIIFTADSARQIVQLMEAEPALLDGCLFFNDGLQACKVIGSTRISEDFECNGMSMAVAVGYRFMLDGGNELHVPLGNDAVRIIARVPASV